MENETLQDKGKRLQKQRDYRIDVDKYVLVHIDGRSFSRMIKNTFKKPFDDDFVDMMNKTAAYLCEEVQGAKMAYVQSDEISLLLKKDTPEGDIFFGGRLCKMQSIIASLATSKFCQLMTIWHMKNAFLLKEYISENDAVNKIACVPLYQFDCKVWDVDNANDAFAWFLFRNIDCVRNSKQQTAQAWCSHNELLGKNTDAQIALLKAKEGIDWNDFPQGQKYGRFIGKIFIKRTVTLPNGRETEVERSVWKACDGVDLTDVKQRENFFKEYPFFGD